MRLVVLWSVALLTLAAGCGGGAGSGAPGVPATPPGGEVAVFPFVVPADPAVPGRSALATGEVLELRFTPAAGGTEETASLGWGDPTARLHLPPGVWRLTARARGAGGAWVIPEATLDLEVEDGTDQGVYAYRDGEELLLREAYRGPGDYPRPGAGSILEASVPLPALPVAEPGRDVAILDWTGRDASATGEDLLALCHTLAPLAVPHRLTDDLDEALLYPVVMVAGVLPQAGGTTAEERAQLLAYLAGGGVLALWRPRDAELLQSLGVLEGAAVRDTVLRPVQFVAPGQDPALLYLDHEDERDWALELPGYAVSRGYQAPAGEALGRWEDGNAAVLRVDHGAGRAYLFGWRQRHVLTQAEQQVVPGDEPSSTNTLVLDADILRLLARGLVEGALGRPVPRVFAPEGKAAALVLTHDVDSTNGYARIEEFSTWEEARGLRSTFLLTTSPYRSGWVGWMYSPQGRLGAENATALGFDVQSHGFGHFPDFADAPYGSGQESAASYAPFYSEVAGATTGDTVLGEVGVSRWLLEGDLGVAVGGFRGGHLYRPPGLFRALAATGYRRDSTNTAPLSRGAFPFQAFELTGEEVVPFPVMEYPLALSDNGLDGDTVPAVVAQWLAALECNLGNGAPTVLLLHTSSRAGKLEALGSLLDGIAGNGMDPWIGDWTTFGEFWEGQGVTCDHQP